MQQQQQLTILIIYNIIYFLEIKKFFTQKNCLSLFYYLFRASNVRTRLQYVLNVNLFFLFKNTKK